MQPIHLITMDESNGDQRIDRFPETPRAVYTVSIHTANFIGVVRIEGTIALTPTDADWFVIHDEAFNQFVLGEGTRRNRTVNLEGRFISMRASSSRASGWPLGSVDRVTVL